MPTRREMARAAVPVCLLPLAAPGPTSVDAGPKPFNAYLGWTKGFHTAFG